MITPNDSTAAGPVSTSHQAAASPGVKYPRVDSIDPKAKYPFQLSGIPFGQCPNDPEFTKLHLGLTRDRFQAIQQTKLPAGFVIEKVVGADPETMADMFLADLEKVGSPYGWDARHKYQPENRADLVEKMKDPETRLYHFEIDGIQVGFCLLSAVKKHRQTKSYEQGVDKHRAVMMFDGQEQQSANFPKPIEIYKIGLYPDQVGNGRGTAFLQSICAIIFNKNYNMIYLDTRDTNPIGTEEFYAKNGFRVFFSQRLKNDLARAVPWPPSLTPEAQVAQLPRPAAANGNQPDPNQP